MILRDFIYKIAKFMEGRYGHDKLNTFLLILAGIIYFINLFFRTPWLFVIVLIPIAFYIFRALSKNITKRLYENRQFERVWNSVRTFFKNQYLRIRDFKTHRYVKCPYCKSMLRLKKRTGNQTIHCPKCNEDFQKNILF